MSSIELELESEFELEQLIQELDDREVFIRNG